MSVEAASRELWASLTAPPKQASVADLGPGLHENIPARRYFQRELGVASKSALDLIDQAPAVYKAWVDGAMPDESTAAIRFGNVLHTLVLEPDMFASRYAVAPDFGDCRKTECKLRRDAWMAKHVDHEMVTKKDFEAASKMAASLQVHPLVGKILRRPELLREVTLRWNEVGLPCKGRLDALSLELGVAIDLKTTEDARPRSFRRSVENYRYDVQQAFYQGGLAKIGLDVPLFLFVAVEKSAPYLCRVYELSQEDVAAGYDTAQRNLETLMTCLIGSHWPGYPTDITTLKLRRWAD